jgi:hypothetical protein
MAETHDFADHSTLVDVFDCPVCRPHAIEELRDGSEVRLILFFEPDDAVDGDPIGLALIRIWPNPDPQVEAEVAWLTSVATGCNLDAHFIVDEVPLAVVDRAAVPLFTLIKRPACVAALDAIVAAWRDEP